MNIRSRLTFLAAACAACLLAGPIQAQGLSPAATAAPADAVAVQAERPGSPSSVPVNNEQISYATGVVTVRNFAKNKIELDVDALIRGMRDAIAGNKSLAMNDKEIRNAMNALQVELRRMDKLNKREAADVNNKRGLAFQAEYKLQPGVKALGNGVLYREIKPGTGPTPGELDHVVVNYRGSLTDGTEFDATHADQPATLRLVQGIMGWREALKRMPKGATWEIVIPHPLAYGERGVPGTIGPNETLVFQVELVDIQHS